MSLVRELPNYGISTNTSSMRFLDGDASPEHLDYLDLHQSSTGQTQENNLAPFVK